MIQCLSGHGPRARVYRRTALSVGRVARRATVRGARALAGCAAHSLHNMAQRPRLPPVYDDEGENDARWPPWAPRGVRLDRATDALVDGVVAYFALEAARALLQWADGTRAPGTYYPLATHVPYALAEQLAANDDLYTPVLRALFAGYSWDVGDDGATVDEDGRYYFRAPPARLADWVPVAERLLAGGAFVLSARPGAHPARDDADRTRFPLRVERAPSGSPAADGATAAFLPPPAVLGALQARHAPRARPRDTGPALVFVCPGSHAALCGVRYPDAPPTDPRATDCAVPLRATAQCDPPTDAQLLLEAQLAFALEARVLVTVLPPD